MARTLPFFYCLPDEMANKSQCARDPFYDLNIYPRIPSTRRFDLLPNPASVVGDERLGVLNNILWRTIVDSKQVCLERTPEEISRIDDVVGSCTAPLEYGLVIITGYGKIGLISVDYRTNQRKVQGIYILELIYKYFAQPRSAS